MRDGSESVDVAIVGGAGHVGLTVGLAFAKSGLRVLLIDKDVEKLTLVGTGHMPFMDVGGEDILHEAIREGKIITSNRPGDISRTNNIVLAIGTPVDSYGAPRRQGFLEWVEESKAGFHPDQLVVLRSTVVPGTSEWLDRELKNRGFRGIHVASCPERAVQGFALQEFPVTPQLIGADSEEAYSRAFELFERVSPVGEIRLSRVEAEMAKLFTNSYRYVNFAIANELLMLSAEYDASFKKILGALKFKYPRASSIPTAGFSAGPCLLKDTLQLSSSARSGFRLGLAAVQVNESVPDFLVHRLARSYDFENLKVAVLGAAFKADSDDHRDSLSFKLRRSLEGLGATVKVHDPFVKHHSVENDLEEALKGVSLAILATPHAYYREISIAIDVADLWGFLSKSRCENLISF